MGERREPTRREEGENYCELVCDRSTGASKTSSSQILRISPWLNDGAGKVRNIDEVGKKGMSRVDADSSSKLNDHRHSWVR